MSATNPLISETGDEITDATQLTDDHFLETEGVDGSSLPLSAHVRLAVLRQWLATQLGTSQHWLHGSALALGANETVLLAVPGRALTLPAGLPNTVLRCGTAPTANAVFDLQVNGVSKGSLTIAAGATAGTASFAADCNLAADDLVRLVGPSASDATLADLAVALSAVAA